MRNLSKWLGATVIAGFAAACSIHAADANKWYFNADAGVNIIQDVTFKAPMIGHATASFDPGMRLDLSGGYKLSDSFALEIESGFTYNQIDKVGGHSAGSDNNLYQVPVLVNLAYSYAFNDKWSVYASAGAGVGINTLDLKGAGSDTDCTFDYQASLGVKYAFSQNCAVGLGYKFLGTTDNDWKFHGVPMKSDAVFNHSILLNFTYKF